MTNLEMLVFGIEQIAKNHNLNCDTDYEENGEVCIWGGCNVPTLCDVRMLCEDLGIDADCIESNDYGIDIYITDEWYEEMGEEEYIKTEELWLKR